MNDLVRYEPTESGNIVTHVIRQISENSEIVLSVTAITSWVSGFVCFISNEAGLYHSRQISIRSTRKNFDEIVSLLQKGYDSRARATYNFCQRVHFLKDSEAKYKFMYQVVSAFQHDMSRSLEQFSELEGQLVNRFFENPFGH
jgi:hypothetical protein